MHKKRVLFIIESMIVGGAEKVLVDLVNNLDATKYDVTVCSVFKHSVYPGYDCQLDSAFAQNVRFRYLVDNTNTFLYRLFNFLVIRFPNILYHLLVKDDYDVVAAFYEGLPTRWLAQTDLRRGKKLTWLHNTVEHTFEGWSTEKIADEEKYYTPFSRILAVSSEVKRGFGKLFPAQESKLAVAFNPLVSESIIGKSVETIVETKPECPLIVSIGRISSLKAYPRLLRAINRVNNLGHVFEYWIIGGGDNKELLQYCKDNNINNVKFLGNKTNPYPYIKIADWMACFSKSEGLSTVIRESLILQKAMIVTKCAGMDDLLGDNERGIIVDNEEDAIVDGIINIMEHPFLKEEYESKVASQQNKFALENTISVIEEIIDTL